MSELRTIEKVGFVGLGSIGRGIARRIMDAGHTMVCWNRTKSKAEDLRGGLMTRVCITPSSDVRGLRSHFARRQTP